MKDEERIELLKEVARVAPNIATYNEDSEWVEIGWNKQCADNGHLTFGRDDEANGTPILAMLCAMDAAGCHAMLRHGLQLVETGEYDEDGPCTEWQLMPPGAQRFMCSSDEGSKQSFSCRGSTRAEAVARAFVAVFSLTEVPQP